MKSLKIVLAKIWNDILVYIANNWRKVAVIAAFTIAFIVIAVLAVNAFKGLVNVSSLERVSMDYRTLVYKIRELAKLEVADLVISDIVDWRKTKKLFGLVKISEAKASYIIRARVIVTVDLSNVSERDVKIDGKKVTIRVPDPTLGVVDLEVVDIYDVDNGVFVKITPKDTVKAMEDMEDQIKRSALYRYKILEEAKRNAEKFLEGFIKAFGFEDVKVIFANVRKVMR